MASWFRPFMVFYGGIHVIGGIVLWANPGVTGAILFEPLPDSAGALLGFASLLGGLGFTAAAGITERSGQRIAVAACLLANLLDAAAHLHNVVRGYSPASIGLAAGITVGLFMGVLAGIYYALRTEETNA